MPFALRVAVSVALLALVLSQVEWRALAEAVSRADLLWLCVAFAAFNGSMMLAATRWRLIVAASSRAHTGVGARAAVAATYVSLWLSNFLPTAFGGDVARVLTARRAGASLPVSLSSAILDRYLGLTTLALLFCFVEAARAVAGESRPLLPIAAALAVGFGVLLAGVWAGAHVRLHRRWLRARAVRFAARATGLLRDLASSRGARTAVMGASLVATLLGVAAYWGAIRCVSTSIDFSTALAVAAVGTVASAIPISLSGWGVREGAVALMLTQSGGLSSGDASLVAVLNGLVIGATSLIGLVVTVAAGWGWSGAAHDGAARRVVPRPGHEA